MKQLLVVLAILMTGWASPAHAQDGTLGMTVWPCSDKAPSIWISGSIMFTPVAEQVYAHEMDHVSKIKELGLNCKEFQTWSKEPAHRFTLEASAYCVSAQWAANHNVDNLDLEVWVRIFARTLFTNYGLPYDYVTVLNKVRSYCMPGEPPIQVGLVRTDSRDGNK